MLLTSDDRVSLKEVSGIVQLVDTVGSLLRGAAAKVLPIMIQAIKLTDTMPPTKALCKVYMDNFVGLTD